MISKYLKEIDKQIERTMCLQTKRKRMSFKANEAENEKKNGDA